MQTMSDGQGEVHRDPAAGSLHGSPGHFVRYERRGLEPGTQTHGLAPDVQLSQKVYTSAEYRYPTVRYVITTLNQTTSLQLNICAQIQYKCSY